MVGEVEMGEEISAILLGPDKNIESDDEEDEDEGEGGSNRKAFLGALDCLRLRSRPPRPRRRRRASSSRGGLNRNISEFHV